MFKASFLKVLLFIGIASSLVITGCFGDGSASGDGITRNTSNRNLLQKKNFKLSNVDELQQLFTYDDSRYPLISAHRGGAMKGYPENAIETFQHVANNLPVIIECDIRITKDSVLVLMHDKTVDRTTNGTGRVDSFTLDELKKLSLKDTEGNITNFKIPTLEEALLWGNNKVVYTLDIKEGVPYPLLSSIIDKTNAKPYVVVITYNARQARELYNINPDFVLSVSIESEADFRRITEVGIPDNKLVAFVGTSVPDNHLIDLLHRHGIKVILGTMGNLDNRAQKNGHQVYAEYIDNGADILSTNYPLEAKKALDYYIRKRNLSSPFIN